MTLGQNSRVPEDWKRVARKDWKRMKRNLRDDDAEAAGYLRKAFRGEL